MTGIAVTLWVWSKPIVAFLRARYLEPMIVILVLLILEIVASEAVKALKDKMLWVFYGTSLFCFCVGLVRIISPSIEETTFNPYLMTFLLGTVGAFLIFRGVSTRESFAGTLRYFLLITLAIIFLLPFYWMFVNSLKSFSEIFAAPSFLPKSWRWSNYSDIFRNPQLPFGRYFRNTFVIATVATLGQLVSCSIVAYAFARIRFRGRGFLFLVVLATMMVPFQVTMIPLFIGFKFLNEHHFLGLTWLNSMLPIIVPQLFATAFNVFLLRQFFRTIPYELDEAAHIDGCSKFGIYWRVILPLSKPALIIVGLFTFFWNWKDLMGPLVYMNARDNTTVSLGLMFLKNPKHIDWQLIMAASTISLIPVVILFFIGQRYIIRGITMTGMKA